MSYGIGINFNVLTPTTIVACGFVQVARKAKMNLSAWRVPFKFTVKVLAFSVIWLLLGMVFMFGGMVVLAAGVRGGSTSLVVAMILFAMGYLIIYGGILMAMFRYLPEAIAEKVKGY